MAMPPGYGTGSQTLLPLARATTDHDRESRRHGIGSRAAQFLMAAKVIGSITASVIAK